MEGERWREEDRKERKGILVLGISSLPFRTGVLVVMTSHSLSHLIASLEILHRSMTMQGDKYSTSKC